MFNPAIGIYITYLYLSPDSNWNPIKISALWIFNDSLYEVTKNCTYVQFGIFAMKMTTWSL